MSKRSMRKLRGICSDALRAASLSAEFIAFGQANTHFSRIEGLERLRFKKRSRHCPAIAQALGLLSSSALPSCATDRLSARDRAEINQGESLTRRVQSAPRSLSARCETFDNQQGKDVKAKQHWCPLKQDRPRRARSRLDAGLNLQTTGHRLIVLIMLSTSLDLGFNLQADCLIVVHTTKINRIMTASFHIRFDFRSCISFL